jgi:hypothetical protein
MIREVEPPLTEAEVREPLSLDDILKATFGPACPVYEPGRLRNVVLPRAREC